MSVCSKTVLPASFLISALRSSQVISSYGWTPGVVQRRSKLRPLTSMPVKRPSSSTGPCAFALLPEPLRADLRAGFAAITCVPSAVVSCVSAPAARAIFLASPYRLGASTGVVGRRPSTEKCYSRAMAVSSPKPQYLVVSAICRARTSGAARIAVDGRWSVRGGSVERLGTPRGRFRASGPSRGRRPPGPSPGRRRAVAGPSRGRRPVSAPALRQHHQKRLWRCGARRWLANGPEFGTGIDGGDSAPAKACRWRRCRSRSRSGNAGGDIEGRLLGAA